MGTARFSKTRAGGETKAKRGEKDRRRDAPQPQRPGAPQFDDVFATKYDSDNEYGYENDKYGYDDGGDIQMYNARIVKDDRDPFSDAPPPPKPPRTKSGRDIYASAM